MITKITEITLKTCFYLKPIEVTLLEFFLNKPRDHSLDVISSYLKTRIC